MSASPWDLDKLMRPTRKKRSATSETSSIVNPAVKLLNTLPNVRCIRVNSGRVTNNFRGAPVASPDIWGSVAGKAFVIECKLWKLKASKPSKDAWVSTLDPAQRDWYQANGHLFCYGVAYSVEDCVELVKGWMGHE